MNQNETSQRDHVNSDLQDLSIETFQIDELADLDVNAALAVSDVSISLCSSTCSSSCG